MSKVYQCIAKVQAALSKDGIGKDRQNTQQGYKFRGIDDVYAALAPLLAEHGLLILPNVHERAVTECTSKGGGTLFYTNVMVDYTLVCVEDGSTHVVRSAGEAMDSGDKSTNKALSSAYKNMALQAFCVRTDSDNDTENSDHQVVGNSQPQRPPAASKPRQQGTTTKPDCPQCGVVEPVMKSQYNDAEWYCNKNRGGCGAKWEQGAKNSFLGVDGN